MPKTDAKSIHSALLSVYSKDGLLEFANNLVERKIRLIASGGTHAFLRAAGLPVASVEDLTTFGEMLGGRVKTLHPHIFGGILARRSQIDDLNDLAAHHIPLIDLVVVDLYPFESAVAQARTHEEIIEKIDVGGVSLLRAAAKNYEDVAVISSPTQYSQLLSALTEDNGTSLELRRSLSAAAFGRTTDYDRNIAHYISGASPTFLPGGAPVGAHINLRYGENPQQEGRFYGNIDQMVEVLGGKQLSYNNILDVDSALTLLAELPSPSFAVIKHNNPCGVAHRPDARQAWESALAGDPVSAFGGIIATNHTVELETAREIDKIFYEILVAPQYSEEALALLQKKKNRIILRQTSGILPPYTWRSALNGLLWQSRDERLSGPGHWKVVTHCAPDPSTETDLIMAEILVKHTRSNAIVLVKNQQLIGSGMGQASRIDALRQAVHKARSFGFDLAGAVLASDAFFPFADAVEAAYAEGITTLLQPGGSLRDQESIDFCNHHQMAMVCTGLRHFKH